MSKILQISTLLKQRIKQGDYALKGFPTDRELCEEIGAARMTVRRAVQQLVDEGVLVKKPNKRPQISSIGTDSKVKQIALLGTSFPTPLMERWHQDIERAAKRKGWQMRSVSFHHADDPVIHDTLLAFDGIFVHHSADIFPALTRRLTESPKPVIVLDADYSAEKLVSIRLAPHEMQMAQLLDHLGALGHRTVDCLNVQPHGRGMLDGLAQWKLWNQTHGGAGRLLDRPVEPGNSPMPQAYEVIKERLADGLGDTTAILCTIFPAAVAAMRAIHEAGLVVGKDVSVCCCNTWAELATHMVPSLTHTFANDAGIYLDACMDWIERGGDWEGPHLIRQHQISLFEGESTRPVQAS
ncbi:MAG: substrate-binding domain-containing protein [Phycisphaeraceae bacterium JB051]